MLSVSSKLRTPAFFRGPQQIGRTNAQFQLRTLNTDAGVSAVPRRSWLYVPCSSDRKLQKSLSSPSDALIYDLEDSVAPSAADKAAARDRLTHFLASDESRGRYRAHAERVAVRVNAVDTPHFREDVRAALAAPHVHALVLPKVHSAADLDVVADTLRHAAPDGPPRELRLVASIESARALWDAGEIAAWRPRGGLGALEVRLGALLFAAEDFCADTSIIRTRGRLELLYARSRIVAAAKAFKLEAIDMVCVNYKDAEYMEDEFTEARRLGFSGKQAIHPDQVAPIHSAFAPSTSEVLRAAKIAHAMARAHASAVGAVGLPDEKGGTEMIDAPMLKQAERTLELARGWGLEIPRVE